MAFDQTQATQLLERASRGDGAARDELAPILYDELHRIASEWMAGQRDDHTLQPTALVNEAWLRLFPAEGVRSFDGRGHFLRLAAAAMRSVLVDHARAKRAAKRGEGGGVLPLDAALMTFEERSIDVVELSDAIEQLDQFGPDLGRVVELRFFGGLTIPETASALGLSRQTVDRRWRVARMWLRRNLPA